MRLMIFGSEREMAEAAASRAASILGGAIRKRGKAVFVAATGKSQVMFLEILTSDKSVDWGRTVMFHLDEYVGLPDDHPAGFRRFLDRMIIGKVHPGACNLIDGNAKDPVRECERLGSLISKERVDVAFLGIGENGHIAFDEPPADFQAGEPYRVVRLDRETLRQEFEEGWFRGISDVPKTAISMSVKQIMKSENIICLAPERRKAGAVRECFGSGPVSGMHPASVLKRHKRAYVYLDRESSSLLRKDGNETYK